METVVQDRHKFDPGRFRAVHSERAAGAFGENFLSEVSTRLMEGPQRALKQLETVLITLQNGRGMLDLQPKHTMPCEPGASMHVMPRVHNAADYVSGSNFPQTIAAALPDFFREGSTFIRDGNLINAYAEMGRFDQDAGKLASQRIELRDIVLGKIAETQSRIIDLSGMDLGYGLPEQIKNYALIMADHPNYRVQGDIRKLLAGLAKGDLSRPIDERIAACFLFSGTSFTELEFIARLREHHLKPLYEAALLNNPMLEHVKAFNNALGLVMLDNSEVAASYGRILAEAAITPDVIVDSRNLLREPLKKALAPYLRREGTNYITLINFLLNLGEGGQENIVRQLEDVLSANKGYDLRIVADLPIVSDEAGGTSYGSQTHQEFSNYVARELLLLPSDSHGRFVDRKARANGNLEIEIGIEMKKGYRLKDSFGNDVQSDGKAAMLTEGQKLVLFRTRRFSMQTAQKLASGAFTLMDSVDLGILPEVSPHVLLYASSRKPYAPHK